jgi:hypothetical protein
MSPLESSAVAPAAAECGFMCNAAIIGVVAVGTWWALKKMFGQKKEFSS